MNTKVQLRPGQGLCTGCNEVFPIVQMYLMLGPLRGRMRSRSKDVKRQEMHRCESCWFALITPPIVLPA